MVGAKSHRKSSCSRLRVANYLGRSKKQLEKKEENLIRNESMILIASWLHYFLRSTNPQCSLWSILLRKIFCVFVWINELFLSIVAFMKWWFQWIRSKWQTIATISSRAMLILINEMQARRTESAVHSMNNIVFY